MAITLLNMDGFSKFKTGRQRKIRRIYCRISFKTLKFKISSSAALKKSTLLTVGDTGSVPAVPSAVKIHGPRVQCRGNIQHPGVLPVAQPCRLCHRTWTHRFTTILDRGTSSTRSVCMSRSQGILLR